MKKNICKLYVVRHGQSLFNHQEIVCGHVDPPLTELGRKQAAEAKRRLSKVKFDDVYSSDLQRAAETGAIIYGKPVPKNHQLHILRERTFGYLEGKPGKDLKALFEAQSEVYDALDDEQAVRYKHHPTIESDYELSVRFVQALHKVAAENLGKTILVAAHGAAIRTSLVRLGYATLKELPSESFENAGYVELIFENGNFTVGEVMGANKVRTNA